MLMIKEPNPPAHADGRPWTPGRWGRLAWLPIPLLLAAIIAARLAGPRESYESQALLLVLSFTFYTLVSLGTLYLIGRSFLGSGSPGLLLLECGVVLWSLAGTVGDFVSHGDANINVTIFNTGILLAGLCHLAGTILSLRPPKGLHAKPLWLAAGCAAALAALWLVSQAALKGWLPVFFIPGQGGTAVRYVALCSAIAMFALSAGLLKANERAARLPFTFWYSLALLMLAVGLFGVMIQLSLGSVVNWLSRTAQWLGGIYLLLAALASLRQAQLPLLPPEKDSQPAYYRDAIAVAMVLASTAMRLAFLSTLGTRAPFVTFYPVVVIASIYGGLRAGLLATALSAVLVDYFWMVPVGRFGVAHPSDLLAIIVFLLSGAMIAGVSEAMHRARAGESAAEKQTVLATERAAAAEALLESRAKLEAALASMTDAVFISDTEGRFVDFNDAFATFHRFRNRDECAKTFAEYPNTLDLSTPDGVSAPPDRWPIPRALRGETATNAEYTLRRKDTGETWVGSYSFGPIRDKDGRITGAVAAVRDVTEGKKAEAELQASRKFLEIANTNNELDKLLREFTGEIQKFAGCEAVAIRLLDEDGNIPYLSYAGFSRTFYETESPLSVRTDKCMCINVVKGTTDPALPFYTEGGSFYMNGTTRFLATVSEADKGESRNVCNKTGYESVALVPIRARSRIMGLIHVADRKENMVPRSMVTVLEKVAAVLGVGVQRALAEATLVASAAKLEESNKDLESFSYSVSHDLRAPLRAIDGYSRMILKSQGERFDEETRRRFRMITDNAEMMNRLIDDLLAFSRLGRQEVARQDFDAEDLIREVWQELVTIHPDREMTLKVGQMPAACGDRALVRQVYGNLLGNAVKFTQRREAAVVEAGSCVRDGETVYYVRDNGVGFDMQYRDKLFGVFQRLHGEQEYKGTGIGLALVQRIVQRHGGRVWAEGEVDKGAAFYFTLPAGKD